MELTMSLDQALTIVKAAGFRVTKPKPSKVTRPTLNAVGKPYSPQYDPKYKIKHKLSTGHLRWPYSANMRFVGDSAPKPLPPRYARANERKRKRAQANAPAWLLEADKLNQSAV
jgi:hypothetical protein